MLIALRPVPTSSPFGINLHTPWQREMRERRDDDGKMRE